MIPRILKLEVKVSLTEYKKTGCKACFFNFICFRMVPRMRESDALEDFYPM